MKEQLIRGFIDAIAVLTVVITLYNHPPIDEYVINTDNDIIVDKHQQTL